MWLAKISCERATQLFTLLTEALHKLAKLPLGPVAVMGRVSSFSVSSAQENGRRDTPQSPAPKHQLGCLRTLHCKWIFQLTCNPQVEPVPNRRSEVLVRKMSVTAYSICCEARFGAQLISSTRSCRAPYDDYRTSGVFHPLARSPLPQLPLCGPCYTSLPPILGYRIPEQLS